MQINLISHTSLQRLFVRYFLLHLFVASTAFSQAQQFTQPAYKLPDPLIDINGKKVTNTREWYARRKELLEIFSSQMYGQSPARPAAMTFKVFDNDNKALNGKAIRKQVTVYFTGKEDGPQMDILIYLPNKSKQPAPVFVELNFQGNQSVNADPAIRLSKSWMAPKTRGTVDNHATDSSRGTTSKLFPVEKIIDRGYGIATIYCGDLDPDFDDGFINGVQAMYPELQGRGDNFSTIAAWAWGLSRAMDYFETDKDINSKRVAVFGFSRLGKATLWAGAKDERFAMVISNESGAGGAKLFHRNIGEKIRRLNTVFPHWYCNNFRNYMDKDSILPFDQHMIIALVAPRPVYVASALEDTNSDPEGEFQGAKAAEPVYKLFTKDGLPTDKWPAPNHPVMGQIAYHVRTGKHDVTDYDWSQYLDFADKHL